MYTRKASSDFFLFAHICTNSSDDVIFAFVLPMCCPVYTMYTTLEPVVITWVSTQLGIHQSDNLYS